MESLKQSNTQQFQIIEHNNLPPADQVSDYLFISQFILAHLSMEADECKDRSNAAIKGAYQWLLIIWDWLR